jgi:GTP pyrophosphokinase
MIEEVSNILNENGLKHKIKGRSKSIYSIYKKLDKGKKFSEIYDLLALRIFVDTESECYQALGLIHSKFKPKPKRFKDYIAMPKTNMYQSLHTTVFGNDGYLYEIQIRTYAMDEVAESGIASHWSYKENGSNKIASKNMMEDKLQFFRSLMEMNNEEITDKEFVSSVKEEFNNTIYVFTPNGDVIELPSGSTPIDFAYKVHSGVGDKMVGAVVNDNLVPLDYTLQNEDVVKINTNKNSKGPSREWINMAKTAQAKNKIRSFFKKQNREEYLKKGEEIFNKELRKKKIPYNEFFTNENIDKILKELKMPDLNELFIAIGDNKISPITVINIIFSDSESKEEIMLKKVTASSKNQTIKKDIIIDGIDEIKLNLASCCKPIPGDSIVGFITKGYGITIHKMNCPNLENMDERFINAKWGDTSLKKYPTDLLIRTQKKENSLLEIISKASNYNINVETIHTYNNLDDIMFEITILVENNEKLLQFISSVKSIPSCLMVERSMK